MEMFTLKKKKKSQMNLFKKKKIHLNEYNTLYSSKFIYMLHGENIKKQ